MAIEDRALGYVVRANDALVDLDRAEQIWAESVRSTSDEMLLHRLPTALDDAVRKVDGPFESWQNLDPSDVEKVAERGPVKLLQLLSCHPNGRAREAFVRLAADLPDDQVLPHLANRAMEFVPAIRDLAGRDVKKRIAEELSARSGPGPHGALPTSIHIAVTKLLVPRTARLDAGLLHACMDLARTTTTARPGRLREHALERMRSRCEQSAVAMPEASEAIADLVSFFEESSAA